MNKHVLDQLRRMTDRDLVEVAYQLALTYPSTFREMVDSALGIERLQRVDVEPNEDGVRYGNIRIKKLQDTDLQVSFLNDSPFCRTSAPIRIDSFAFNHLNTMTSDQKVTAIKWCREKYGLGLKEAKDLIEGLGIARILPQFKVY